MKHAFRLSAWAMLLTAISLAVAHSTLDRQSWFFSLFFERSCVQWISCLVFFYGMVALITRMVRLRAERNLLESMGDHPLPTPMPEGSYLATYRYVLTLAQETSRIHLVQREEEHAAELNRQKLDDNYGPVTEAIYVLPLVGFFGTLLGLSEGLYSNFVAQTSNSTDSFARAIGTAFDTTLVSLALTIVLFIAQTLVRRMDEGFLRKVSEFVNARVKTHATPAERTRDAKQEAAEIVVDWLQQLSVGNKDLTVAFQTVIRSMADFSTKSQERLNKLCDTLDAVRAHAKTQADRTEQILAKHGAILAELGKTHEGLETTIKFQAGKVREETVSTRNLIAPLISSVHAQQQSDAKDFQAAIQKLDTTLDTHTKTLTSAVSETRKAIVITLDEHNNRRRAFHLVEIVSNDGKQQQSSQT